MVLFVCADALVATVVRYFTEQKIRGDQNQKLYADLRGNMVEPALDQLIGSVRVFDLFWARDELITGQSEKMNQLVVAPSTNDRYLRLDWKTFLDNIYNELRAVRD